MLVESPTFLGAIQCMRIRGANIVSIPTDEEGVIPEDGGRADSGSITPKLMYIIPTFQNPTGITLSARAAARPWRNWPIVTA